MGIRFERDSRKATNGPLIFFSLLKDETFAVEIRSAYLSGLSFYAYRGPGESMLTYGSSEGYVVGIGQPGFVIGMFDSDKPILTIPFRGHKKKEFSEQLYVMPTQSTPRNVYIREVEEIVKALRGNTEEKVVAARVIVKDEDLDPAEKFYELCSRFPKAFVFCFSTPATGCWIGATPELLLRCRHNTLETMALAGTRPIERNDETWDRKNIEEQKIVADYIVSCLGRHYIKANPEATFTKSAGTIQHICTPIYGMKPEGLNLAELLRDLSPTPALCGYPKSFALEKIKDLENFDRGCYGGFCGPYRGDSDFEFNVTLRCAAISQRRICSYVGAGVTCRSKADSEWEETEMKAL